MADKALQYQVAAVQMAPVWLDREATTEKVCSKIRELGQQGIRLIVFPEVIIPGTPHWNWIEPRNTELFVKLYYNAVEVPSLTLTKVARACREVNSYVVLGIHEREGKNLYNTIVFINDQGCLMGKHRKIMPTHSEKIIWAPGDASGLKVYQTPFGKLGGLICGEHNMSLARFALASQGEEIHAALWVSGTARRGESFNRQVDIWCCSYALANQAFVISAQACASAEEISRFGFEGPGGGSAVIYPDGVMMARSSKNAEEDVICEIDFSSGIKTYPLFDSVSYHGRPDIFDFRVKNEGVASDPAGGTDQELVDLTLEVT